MKKMNLMTLLTIAGLYSLTCTASEGGGMPGMGGMAGTQVNVLGQIAATTCTGAGARCPVTQTGTMNEVGGETFKGDPKDLKVTDLGTIDADKEVDVALPQKTGNENASVYSLTTKDGAKLFFAVKLDPKGRPGTKLAGVTSAEVLAHKEGASADAWARVGQIKTTKETFPATMKFKVAPNGNLELVGEDASQTFDLNAAIEALG